MEENQMQHDTPAPRFAVGKKEWIFGAVCLLCGLCLANFVLYGSFNAGFALGSVVMTFASFVYLVSRGHKLTTYPGALLVLSMVIAAGFARSDDDFVKFVLFCFLAVAENLGLCLLAGQNRRAPGGFATIWDAPRTLFVLGLGKIEPVLSSMRYSAKNSGKAGKVGGGLLLGLVLAVPLLIVVVLLLIRADAAFSGLVALLPEVDGAAIFGTVFLGAIAFCLLFSRGVALHHSEEPTTAGKERKGVYPLTVNTVLTALCLVYLAYLFSQLAYFTGGLSGILPEEYTMAQYARQGFFEMAWLCAINLATVAIAVGVVEKKRNPPISTRLLCLFISLITLFFVVTASAKMGMYIGSFGLTRLRVLTEVIMVFLAITTILVAVWLFVPKMPYMKAVLILALIMGAMVLWVDVDTVVAAYNVSAYQNGLLDSVDVNYLSGLSDGAVPYIAKLVDDQNPQVARVARHFMNYGVANVEDFRDWNYATWLAQEILWNFKY